MNAVNNQLLGSSNVYGGSGGTGFENTYLWQCQACGMWINSPFHICQAAQNPVQQQPIPQTKSVHPVPPEDWKYCPHCGEALFEEDK